MNTGEDQFDIDSDSDAPSGRMRGSAQERMSSAVDQARQSLSEIGETLRERVEENPYRSVAIALGAGYVLGGGLFTGLTARLLFGGVRIGTRLAALPFVRDEIFAFVDALSSRERGGQSSKRRKQ